MRFQKLMHDVMLSAHHAPTHTSQMKLASNFESNKSNSKSVRIKYFIKLLKNFKLQYYKLKQEVMFNIFI